MDGLCFFILEFKLYLLQGPLMLCTCMRNTELFAVSIYHVFCMLISFKMFEALKDFLFCFVQDLTDNSEHCGDHYGCHKTQNNRGGF